MSVLSAGLRQPSISASVNRTHPEHAKGNRRFFVEPRRSQTKCGCAGVDLSPADAKAGRTNGASELAPSQPFPDFTTGSSVPYSERLEDDSREHPRMPLVEAIRDRGRRVTETAFHIPGHKRGAGAPHALVELLGGRAAFQHDLTELPGLDYLSAPAGAIKEAQDLAAKASGADNTFFLVNGSTVGIQAAVLATCNPGDALIMARNCHLCAFSAAVLSGAYPIYALPEFDSRLGIAHGISPLYLQREFLRAARKGLKVGAVLVVSPTYFGVTSDIKSLAEVCNKMGVPLIVDEAHGAHFGWHQEFPASAITQGASLAVQSSHKVLGALGQAGLLHTKGPLVSPPQGLPGPPNPADVQPELLAVGISGCGKGAS
eukprot:jgi/Botrbrau1/16221/Bobra.0066s0007.1